MAVNKVIFGGETVVDLTTDTVTPETLAEGVTAHDKAGNAIVGTMVVGGSNNIETLTVNNNTEYPLLVGGTMPLYPGESANIAVSPDGLPFFSFSVVFAHDILGDDQCFNVVQNGSVVGEVYGTNVGYSQGMISHSFGLCWNAGFYPDDIIDIETA